MKLSGYHLHTLRFHFRRGSTFRGTFFQDGRQFTMLYVQTCLVRGPNKVEEHRRCHFQLHQGCRLICRNQISPQIKHGCQLCPHVQCGCVCLSNVQRCLVGYQIAQENTSNVISNYIWDAFSVGGSRFDIKFKMDARHVHHVKCFHMLFWGDQTSQTKS